MMIKKINLHTNETRINQRFVFKKLLISILVKNINLSEATVSL